MCVCTTYPSFANVTNMAVACHEKSLEGANTRSAHIHADRDSSRKSVAVSSSSALCQYGSFFPACVHFCPLNLTHAYDDDSIAYNDTRLPTRSLAHSLVRPFHCLLARSFVRLLSCLPHSLYLSATLLNGMILKRYIYVLTIYFGQKPRLLVFVCLFVSVAFCIRLCLYLPARTHARIAHRCRYR